MRAAVEAFAQDGGTLVETLSPTEIVEGLMAGEKIVVSGNFLVDSESKLNAVLDRMTEPNR